MRHGRMACCDLVVDAAVARRHPIERMSEPVAQRKHPSTDDKLAILSTQSHRCFWCRTPFDGVAVRITSRGQRIVKLSPCWDHVEPFAWSYNNDPLNFVASCVVCNGIKSSKMFPDLEATREHIMARRKTLGWV